MDIKLNKFFAASSAVDAFDVKQMKGALNRLGYYKPFEKTGITGIPDAGVFAALKAFQKDHGLNPTGTARPRRRNGGNPQYGGRENARRLLYLAHLRG